MIQIGDEIPDFTAKDEAGEPIAKEDLLGSPFILYFYPKDDTPGCTKEACNFRDVMEGMEDLSVEVIGISPDSPESHQKFIDKYGLNFPLISDEKKAVGAKFGVLKSDGSVIRTTFLCDAEGVIQWIESPVSVEGHIERIFEAIENTLS